MGSGNSGLYHNTHGSTSSQEVASSGQMADMERADIGNGLSASPSGDGSLTGNLTADFKKEYDFKDGFFGVPGQSDRGNANAVVRNIYSEDNEGAARDFYQRLSEGGVETPLPTDKDGTSHGVRKRMSDGYWIVYREQSKSDGTPVVQISIIGKDKDGQIKKQKIHFVKKEK